MSVSGRWGHLAESLFAQGFSRFSASCYLMLPSLTWTERAMLRNPMQARETIVFQGFLHVRLWNPAADTRGQRGAVVAGGGCTLRPVRKFRPWTEKVPSRTEKVSAWTELFQASSVRTEKVPSRTGKVPSWTEKGPAWTELF